MKSPKNKTIDFSVEDGKPFLDRCITVTSKLSIEELLDRTILGDSLQVLEFLPQQSIDSVSYTQLTLPTNREV